MNSGIALMSFAFAALSGVCFVTGLAIITGKGAFDA